jgi:hypothetical protein
MSDDYEVGYGKPPKGNQFPKGVSGNLKGRPPKVKGAFDPLKVLDAEREVRLKGKKRKMSSGERRLRKQVQLALEDRKVSAMIYWLKEFEKFDLIAGDIQEKQNGVITIPSDMPPEMISLLKRQYGYPPWSVEERAWARRVYLKNRTEQERRDDEFIGWPCLQTGQQAKEQP